MDLIEEISEHFASLENNKYREITQLPKDCIAWSFKTKDDYGVFVEIPEEMKVSEHFSHCHLYTTALSISNKTQYSLVLSCDCIEARQKFAYLCVEFVSPGKENIKRRELLLNPTEWWKEWSELLGNVDRVKEPYAVIAELYAFLKLYKSNKKTQWTGSGGRTHDIEQADNAFEVKSTLSKSMSLIKISSQFQMDNSKDLFLLFYRMEESENGICINHLKTCLEEAGYDINKFEQQLNRLGYENGASSRNKKYQILESRIYKVDDHFPKIVPESFIGGKIPDGVLHIEYTVDLSGLNSERW